MTLPDPDSSWAYLVGVSSFPGRPDLQPLPQVPNNLMDLREALSSGRGGFLPDHCLVALDPAGKGALAADLTRLTKIATDTMLVYYAGHGCLDDDGKLHLTFPDSTRDGFGFNTLEIAVLRRLLARSTARRRVLVLDCCYSGLAIDLMSDIDSQVIAELRDIAGAFTMASAPRTDAAKALAGERYTVFTGELISVLRDGIPDGPELLSLKTVFDTVQRRLRVRGMPEPKHMATGAQELALVRNATWAPPRPAPSAPRPTLPQWLPVTVRGVAGGAVQMASMFVGLLGPDRRAQEVNSQGGVVLSDDPLEVAKLMTSPYPEVETGLRLMQSLVERVHRVWGDGAVTAVLLAAALIEDLAVVRESGAADEVRNIAGEVLAALERRSRPCQREDVAPVLATVSKRDEIRQLVELPGIADWRHVDFVHDEADSVRGTWACALDAQLAWPDPRAVTGSFEWPRISWCAAPLADATPLVELMRSQGSRPFVVFTPLLDPPAAKMLRLNAPRGRLAVVRFGSALGAVRLAEAYQDLAEATGGGYRPGSFGAASAVEFGARSVRLVLPGGNEVRCRTRRAFLRSRVEDATWRAQRLAFLEDKRVTVALDDESAVAALRRACRVGDEGPPRVVDGGGAVALREAGAAITAEGPVAEAWAGALCVPAEHLPESRHQLLDPLPVVRGVVEAVRDVALEYLKG